LKILCNTGQAWSFAFIRIVVTAGLFATIGIGMRSASAASDTAANAVGTVQAYYSAIDAFDYDTAYGLLGSAWQKQQSSKNFTTGFSGTAFVRLEVVQTDVTDANTAIVTVRLTSWHNDGSVHPYAGTYTVGLENDEWRLVDASVAVVKLTVVVPPLCTIRDLAFTTGDWDAGMGNRYGSLIATNTSDTTCVVGGTPRLTVVIKGVKTPIVSTGEGTALPDAIVLKPIEAAVAPIRLANWCPANDAPLTISVMVPGDNASTTLSPTTIWSTPPCLGAGEPPLFTVQGFQLPPQ